MKLGQTGGPDSRHQSSRDLPIAGAKTQPASTLKASKIPNIHSPLSSIPGPTLGRALTHAFQAASLPFNDALFTRLSAVLQSQAARIPALSFPRFARVMLEMELRGQHSSARVLDRLLVEPDFMGLAQQEPVAVGNHGTDGGMTDQGSPHGGHQQSEMSAEQLLASLAQPAHDEKGRQISPAWNTHKLEPLSWSMGGNLRWSSGPPGLCMNIDIVTAEGLWQFHWFEPHRTRIVVGVPAGTTLKKKQKQWLKMLETIVGPLGFKEFHTLKPNDWYDGFNFLSAESILRRVDIVV